MKKGVTVMKTLTEKCRESKTFAWGVFWVGAILMIFIAFIV
jgi:hypothetical protein